MMSELDLARQIAEEIVAQNTEPVLRFTLERGEPGLLDSKVGGTPYLPHDMPWPLDAQGQGMDLLAQINCAALDGLPDFPHTGLLQFFIALDDVFGMDFDNQMAQTGFRVLYHETADPSVTMEGVQAKKAGTKRPDDEDLDYYTPLYESCRIVFSAPANQHISGADFRAFQAFIRRWNELHPDASVQDKWELYQKTKIGYPFPDLEDGGPWHQLGGYPYFTQEDPRSETDSKYADLDVLLFQLDSDGTGREDLVLWGDCGVANFFINRDALKQRDFSQVCYNWDCC